MKKRLKIGSLVSTGSHKNRDNKMDSERLNELAKDVMALLKNNDIPAERFVMKILVPREYYETIKENFPDRHPIDVIVGSGEENWAIDISYSHMPQGGAYTEQSEPPMR